VQSTKSGVLTTVAHQQLIATARKAGCTLQLKPALGDYLPNGAALVTIIGAPERPDQNEARNGVVLSMERTLDQDVAYGLRLLVDRPNDRHPIPAGKTPPQRCGPSTGCMTACGSSPVATSRRRRYDDTGQLRLIKNAMTWNAYVHLAFDEIRLAGAGSPQVARRLQAALEDPRA